MTITRIYNRMFLVSPQLPTYLFLQSFSILNALKLCQQASCCASLLTTFTAVLEEHVPPDPPQMDQLFPTLHPLDSHSSYRPGQRINHRYYRRRFG